MTPDDVHPLAAIEEQVREFQRLRRSMRRLHPPQRPHVFHLEDRPTAGTPLRVDPTRIIGPKAPGDPPPAVVADIVRGATEARVYSRLDFGEPPTTWHYVAWPYTRTDLLPGQTDVSPTLWQGERGANFYGDLTANGRATYLGFIPSLLEFAVHAMGAVVLRFPLPVFDREMTVTWATYARFASDVPWTATTDGSFDVTFLVAPNVDGFPADDWSWPSKFERYPGLRIDAANATAMAAPKQAVVGIERSFRLAAGSDAAIYLGCELHIQADDDGELSSFERGGGLSTFWVDPGITYLAVG